MSETDDLLSDSMTASIAFERASIAACGHGFFFLAWLLQRACKKTMKQCTTPEMEWSIGRRDSPVDDREIQKFH